MTNMKNKRFLPEFYSENFGILNGYAGSAERT